MKPILYKQETGNIERSPCPKQGPSGFHKGHNIATPNLGVPLGGYQAKRHNQAKDGEKEGCITCSK